MLSVMMLIFVPNMSFDICKCALSCKSCKTCKTLLTSQIVVFGDAVVLGYKGKGKKFNSSFYLIVEW